MKLYFLVMRIQKVSLFRPAKFADRFLRKGTLTDGEEVKSFYKGIRDMLLITNKRIITIDKRGLTGKKQAYISTPFDQIVSYAIVTAGEFNLESDVNIYISGLGYIQANILRPTSNIDNLVNILNELLFK